MVAPMRYQSSRNNNLDTNFVFLLLWRFRFNIKTQIKNHNIEIPYRMVHTISIVVHAFNLSTESLVQQQSYTVLQYYILQVDEILDYQDQYESNGQKIPLSLSKMVFDSLGYLTKYFTKLYVIIDSNLNFKV